MEETITNVTERLASTPGLLSGFLTEKELACELNVSMKTLHRWEAVGAGPARTKLGRKVLYSRQAIQQMAGFV